ncbi:hypothetical protein BKA70DRAFT_1220304 [Coprinopsis sp. MPI-PUGE-AT-0042]|nr:hypothetical protein BKA70DRAFT_1220304 [Coprinopsis sp. MPI-PUGE-AT-0042]
MSLPQATKDISEHPTAGAVVDPVNKKAQAADVERKLKLYGVIQAFRQGRMPSNTQIDQTLDFVLKHEPVPTKQLSHDGQKLVQDIRDIIHTAKLMVSEKNADELFQNFVWHTQGASEEVNVQSIVGEAKGTVPDAEKAKKDGEDAVKHLRTLMTLVLTNSEVRKLLSDFGLIGRDLLAKGASKAATNLAPPEEKLRQVDAAAPHDRFVTEGGRKTTDLNETPVLEAGIPGTQQQIRHHPYESTAFVQGRDEHGPTGKPAGEIVQEGREVYGQASALKSEAMRDPQQAAGHAQDQLQSAQSQLSPEQQRKADETAAGFREAGHGVKQDAHEYAEGDEETKEAKKRGLMDRMRDVRDNLKDRIPQEHRERAVDQRDRTKTFFTEEYFPEERRDQFIFRLKKVILECQKHDDYQASMRWLLAYIEEYVRHGKTASEVAAEKAKAEIPTHDAHPIKRATFELRTLLERFANNTSMNGIFSAMDALIDDSRRDAELRTWFRSVDTYLRKVLLQPGYVLEPDCDNTARALRDSGKHFYDDKYKNHFDNLFNEIGGWFKAMGEDPLNQRFGDDWARLTKDLLFDSEGALKFKPQLWNDVRHVVMPTLLQQIGYIPIPRIEYTDESFDLVVENLTLQGRNLLPNIVALDVHNYVKISPYDSIKDENHHKISFTLSQMQADMRDVAFYYHKKSGIPKMKDSGLADVLVGGEGVSAHVTISSTTKDKSSVFRVDDVTVKVDSLKFSIRDSKHDLLYKTLKPLASGLIKKQIQKAIKDGLRTALEYVDGQLVGVRDRMEEAKVTEGQSRADVLKDIFHKTKANAAEVQARTSIDTQGGLGVSVDRSSAASPTSAHSTASHQSQFKIVADKRHSLLSNVGNPSGWVNRAAEKQEVIGHTSDGLVGGGEKGWKSDAFTIVGLDAGINKAGTGHSATMRN